MAIVDPAGEMVFWFEGTPIKAYYSRGGNGNEMQFWVEGIPFPFILPIRTGN